VAPPATPPAAPPASWRDQLPDDIKSAPTLSKFETIEGMAKSYVNLERMLGADKVVIPKDGDTEGWNSFYKAAGKPETPDAYGFKQPETIPEGMQYDAELDTKLAGIMHKGNLNKQQAAVVREELLSLVASGATANLEAAKAHSATQQQAIIQAETALKAEWGQAYEQRGKVAGAAINKFLSAETIAAMDAAGLANNPAIVKDMYNLGVKLAGERELIGEISQSPADLETSIADFRDKHGTALFDRSHPEHAQRTKEYTTLFEKRYV
jgi:hypothetical protein